MKIGILTTGHAPDELRADHGDYADLFQRLLKDKGFSFVNYDVVDMEFPADVHDCDGWLVTGSRHGAYEDHPFIPPLEAFIRATYEAEVPMVGICFGHQIIAQALGGKVEKFKGGWAVGRQVYDWQGQPVALNAWHQDQVVIKPPEAQVCASNEFCENAALVYGHRAFTVQAHPEFKSDFVAGLAAARGKGVVPDAQLAEVANQLHAPIDDVRLASQIAAFFKTREITP
ncbi:MAG: type 1 glutamine amidotransferase [Limimaricola sp.]|uniref:type 1 glutamine amidotransferase n=1 Tax=Limimaricola sp. TaxID=2211665 RepID=UPI001D687EE3|nr:type 1 glutamine amidotransferase [Limimaricola sp.]MBI1416530.1 type 1 glutamine amidotransferase [Limimaricola sp.]